MSRIFEEEIHVARGGNNRMPVGVKRRYFELIRRGCSGSVAALQVGVSLSCGSLWFIDAGSVNVIEHVPISSRYVSQDDRIEIADGLGRRRVGQSHRDSDRQEFPERLSRDRSEPQT